MDFSYLDNWMGDSEETPSDSGTEPSGIWVVADRWIDGRVSRRTFEALGLARTLADSLGAYVKGVLLGTELETLGSEMIYRGADRVIQVDAPELATFNFEIYAEALHQIVTQGRPEFILFPGTARGNNLAGKLAGRLGVALATNCVALNLDESTRTLVATYPIYDGAYNEVAGLASGTPQIATLKPGAFPVPYADTWRTGQTEFMSIDLSDVAPALRSIKAAPLPPEDLPITRARVIVSVGRDLGSTEALEGARQLAESLGGVLAGDRSALDAGYIVPEQVIGATGLTVDPHLYLALGIRGDTYHQYGMTNSQYVIAVHPDHDAPIFKAADVCIIGDPVEVIQGLLQQLRLD